LARARRNDPDYKGQSKRPAHSLVATAAVLLVVMIGGVLYFRSRQATALTGGDTIVLADFANTTGDPVFDRTLT